MFETSARAKTSIMEDLRPINKKNMDVQNYVLAIGIDGMSFAAIVCSPRKH
jgi:hypothetical protein